MLQPREQLGAAGYIKEVHDRIPTQRCAMVIWWTRWLWEYHCPHLLCQANRRHWLSIGFAATGDDQAFDFYLHLVADKITKRRCRQVHYCKSNCHQALSENDDPLFVFVVASNYSVIIWNGDGRRHVDGIGVMNHYTTMCDSQCNPVSASLVAHCDWK